MKLLITLCVVIELSTVAFGLKSDASTFIQATCPALQEKIDELENSYNGLFNLLC